MTIKIRATVFWKPLEIAWLSIMSWIFLEVVLPLQTSYLSLSLSVLIVLFFQDSDFEIGGNGGQEGWFCRWKLKIKIFWNQNCNFRCSRC
jgi:hypothetical protein